MLLRKNFKYEYNNQNLFDPDVSPYYLAVIFTRAVYYDLGSKTNIKSNIFSLSTLKKKEFSEEDIIYSENENSEVIDSVLNYLMRSYIGYIKNPGERKLYEFIENQINKHKTI